MSFAKEETHQHIPHFWSISLRDMERTPGLARSDSRMAIWSGWLGGGVITEITQIDTMDERIILEGPIFHTPLPWSWMMEEAYMIYDMCWVVGFTPQSGCNRHQQINMTFWGSGIPTFKSSICHCKRVLGSVDPGYMVDLCSSKFLLPCLCWHHWPLCWKQLLFRWSPYNATNSAGWCWCLEQDSWKTSQNTNNVVMEIHPTWKKNGLGNFYVEHI